MHAYFLLASHRKRHVWGLPVAHDYRYCPMHVGTIVDEGNVFAASATGVVTAKPNAVANVNAHGCFHYSQFTKNRMWCGCGPKRKKVGAKNIQKETWTSQIDGISALALLAIVIL
jgi:hypothetical protein